jgi:diguanylate cyclase (GGDEF)-like protein
MDVLLCLIALACLGLMATVWRVANDRRVVQACLDQAHEDHARELERLQGLALHDALTGLPNRTLLGDRLRHALSSQPRRGGQVGVLFLDLDGFKAVNDTYGHGTGDQVLALVADRLRSSVRGGDTPARFAGDEFVVICEGVDGPLALAAAAARIERAVAAPMTLGEKVISLGVSVGSVLHGASIHESAPLAAERLLAAADQAMFEIKRSRQLALAEMGVLNQLAAKSVLLA